MHGSHGEQNGVYYLPDHLGSTRAVVNLYGDVLETRNYDPWGNGVAHGPGTPTFHLKHRFTGQPIAEVDAGSGYGLHNYGARFYDPKWGRFISSDEVLEGFDSQGISPFAYVRNRPSTFTDATGQMVSGSVWAMWFYMGASWNRPGSDQYDVVEAQRAKAADAKASENAVGMQGAVWSAQDAMLKSKSGAEWAQIARVLQAQRLADHGIDPITVGVQFGTTAVAGDQGGDFSTFAGVEIGRRGFQDFGAVAAASGPGEISGLGASADTFVLTIFRGEIEDFPSLEVWDFSFGITIKVYYSVDAGRVVGLGGGGGPGYGFSRTRWADGWYKTKQSGTGRTPR